MTFNQIKVSYTKHVLPGNPVDTYIHDMQDKVLCTTEEETAYQIGDEILRQIEPTNTSQLVINVHSHSYSK